MESNLRLTEYVKEHFGDLPLESPLFYNASVGIRFELGTTQKSRLNYLSNVYSRAIMLFQEAFRDDDDIAVVVKTYQSVEPYVCFKQGESVFPKYIKNKADQIACCDAQHIEDDGILSGIINQQVLLCKKDDIDFEGILKAKAHQDFSIIPYTTDEVFFVNLTEHIIFYMYDDRGLDLVAKSKESLQPIYLKFNDWILDYDRERIDRIFLPSPS